MYKKMKIKKNKKKIQSELELVDRAFALLGLTLLPLAADLRPSLLHGLNIIGKKNMLKIKICQKETKDKSIKFGKKIHKFNNNKKFTVCVHTHL